MLHLILAFVITNLSNNSLPYNVTIPSNPLNFPNIIIWNFPWFFPFITMFLFGIGSYQMTKSPNPQMNSRTNLLAVAFGYTVLTYVEVLGSLTNIGWFAVFEGITLALIFIISLFVPKGE